MKFGRIVGKIVTFAETIIYIMKLFFAAVVCMSVLSLSCPADAAGGVKEPPASRHDRTGLRGEFRQALFLYGKGMYEEAMSRFSRLASEYDDPEARGYAVLCAVRMKLPSYGELSRRYLEKYPFTLAASRIKYADALNLFDAGDYAAASAVLESLDPKSLERGQRDEFLFKRAYCDYETGNTGRALERFAELAAGVKPDYAAASSYMAGYICYCGKDFTEAAGWFGQSSGDSRFSAMSRYYIAECRFMLKDYEYVTDNGPGLLESVPEDCLPKLNRIISESYLVLGNAPEARKYYDNFEELTIAVLGLTFKPNTDDLREAPSLTNIPILLDDGAIVKAYDPIGEKNFKKFYPDEITYCSSIEETLRDADICFIFTEWDFVKNLDITLYEKLMRKPIVIDGRNCYNLDDIRKTRITYDSIGRETINPER